MSLVSILNLGSSVLIQIHPSQGVFASENSLLELWVDLLSPNTRTTIPFPCIPVSPLSCSNVKCAFVLTTRPASPPVYPYSSVFRLSVFWRSWIQRVEIRLIAHCSDTNSGLLLNLLISLSNFHRLSIQSIYLLLCTT